jgi:hypothetical protein
MVCIYFNNKQWFQILQAMYEKNFIYFVLFLIYFKLVETLTSLRWVACGNEGGNIRFM